MSVDRSNAGSNRDRSPTERSIRRVAQDTATAQASATQAIADAAAAAAVASSKSDAVHTHAAADTTTGVFNHARLGTGGGGSSKFLREDGTWQAVAGGTEAFPVGAVFIAVVSTDPATLLGYGTWSAFGAGRVLVGRDSGDTDFDTAEETGGAKTVAGAGTNSAPTISGTTAAEASHTHTYTEVPNHVHVIAAGQGSHQHGMAEGTTDGSGNFADRSNAAAASAMVTDLATLPEMVTNDPTGGVATGTTSAGSSHTHGAGTLAASAPTFTGSATSVVQPYIVVYMWKRTA